MIGGLNPYPIMKDSGVEWLGMVPDHWSSRKLRSILHNIAQRNRPDLPLLSVVREKGVVIRNVSDHEENHNFIPDDLKNYKVVQAGQFAMNKMKAWQGSYGVSLYDGIVSPAYFVFDLKNMTRPFFNAAIRSKAYIPFFTQASDGVRIGQWDLSQARMREIPFFIPPLPEQAAIVKYLDYVDRRVRRLIRAKRKLIALLNEQKQALIQRAVTRGLDPDVPLKDSGVEWLGEVPAHWEIVPLKRAFMSMEYGISDSGTDHGTIPILTMGHIRDGLITVPKSGGVTSVPTSLLLQDKDLLFNRTNSAELVAKVGLFRAFDRPVTFASYLVRMRSYQKNCPEFLNFLLNNSSFLSSARREAIPSLHQSNLNPTRYGRLPIPLPPGPEQVAITNYILEQTSYLNIGISMTKREIELLNEYRTRLIADVVTGKLDVREAAATLPEVDPLAANEEQDNTIDEDTEPGLEELDSIPEEEDP
jgi:type I restriction enzyme S subunit